MRSPEQSAGSPGPEPHSDAGPPPAQPQPRGAVTCLSSGCPLPQRTASHPQLSWRLTSSIAQEAPRVFLLIELPGHSLGEQVPRCETPGSPWETHLVLGLGCHTGGGACTCRSCGRHPRPSDRTSLSGPAEARLWWGRRRLPALPVLQLQSSPTSFATQTLACFLGSGFCTTTCRLHHKWTDVPNFLSSFFFKRMKLRGWGYSSAGEHLPRI